MPIDENEIKKYFLVGEVIISGGGRSYYQIIEILADKVRIQPIQLKQIAPFDITSCQL
jgi:hypothetical protein